jgi:hypothetical protein
MYFWEILISGCVAAVPVVIPLVIYVREHRRRSRRTRFRLG